MITPYNAQVRVLSDLFRERGWLEQMTDGEGEGRGRGEETWGEEGGAGGERSERRDRGDERPVRRDRGQDNDMYLQRASREGGGVRGGGGRGRGRGREGGSREGVMIGRGQGGRQGTLQNMRGRGGGERSSEKAEGRGGNKDMSSVDQPAVSDKEKRKNNWEDRGISGSKIQSPVGWVGGRGTFRVSTNDKESTYSRYGRGEGDDNEILSSFSRIKGVKGVSKRAITLLGYAEPTQVCIIFLLIC